ncbi:hypothetical protein [Alphaproteobacteria bacterium endosymbiont of Tiliacea citrago]|uniref:hypothetical protein n=1 Tax=Alphaproteobacteria bacterium endosymbiont of Tiliacea citrago TaxID=3077944 RepID=UPI00313BB4D5
MRKKKTAPSRAIDFSDSVFEMVRKTQRVCNQAIYNAYDFKGIEEAENLLKEGVNAPNLELSLLKDKKNVAYLTAFLCLSMDPINKQRYESFKNQL